MEELTETNRYKTQSGKQLFDILEEELLNEEEYAGFLKGNVYKYLQRYEQKNGVEDLKKARVYLDKLIDETNERNKEGSL